jgi:hypothetical protein
VGLFNSSFPVTIPSLLKGGPRVTALGVHQLGGESKYNPHRFLHSWEGNGKEDSLLKSDLSLKTMHFDMCTQNLAAKASKSAISARSGDSLFLQVQQSKRGHLRQIYYLTSIEIKVYGKPFEFSPFPPFLDLAW